MPIANDMKNIAEGIEISYGERAAFLSDLSKETDETLKTFNREHRKMAGDLWDFLSSDRDNRKNVVTSLRGKNKRELRAMAENLANNLRESTSTMEKDTAEMMTRIKGDIGSMEREIASLLSGFNTERQSMGREMKNELVSTTRERIEQVKKMLATFSADHEMQSRELRHQLSTFQKELESKVKEMRAPVIRDLQEAKQNWQNLSRIMAAKRAGKTVTVAKRIDEVPKEEVAEAVEAFTAGNLKEHILRLISETTSGMRLAKMGAILAVPFIRLAKPASELVKEGKIQKRGLRYLKV